MPSPAWSDPNLPPDQFLYQRKGPWPQPSPAFPMELAPEILNIPPVETLLWTEAIGSRYFKTQNFYTGGAGANAVAGAQLEIPGDPEFVRLMTGTVYARFLRPAADPDLWVACFPAMALLADVTLPGTYACPVNCTFRRDTGGFSCVSIEVHRASEDPLEVKPTDPAWNLAKAYALQCAAYIGLFVVHPALHFPMDSINAITKTAVPRNHPLFQLLIPHCAYALAVNNAVLETEDGVLSNNVQGTWYDPLTANGRDIKRLFGAGYSGLPGHEDWYPPFDYTKPWMDRRVPYGRCLDLYFPPFLKFCGKVADFILKASDADTYVARWAHHISAHVKGFPDANAIFQGDHLARALAIYMWDVTVAHAADHFSFANQIAPKTLGPAKTPLAAWKFLRLRVPPPRTLSDGGQVARVGDVCDPDDLYRAEMTQALFFQTATLWPNLFDTTYAFTDPTLLQAQNDFHTDLAEAATQVAAVMPDFMPLQATDPADYGRTISASIQY